MNLNEFASELLNMIEPIASECLCIDPPGDFQDDPERQDYDDPEAHSQYCPIYLYHYIKRFAAARVADDPYMPTDTEWAA